MFLPHIINIPSFFLQVVVHALDDGLLVDEAVFELEQFVFEALDLLLLWLQTGLHLLRPVCQHLLCELQLFDGELQVEQLLDLVLQILLDLVLCLLRHKRLTHAKCD